MLNLFPEPLWGLLGLDRASWGRDGIRTGWDNLVMWVCNLHGFFTTSCSYRASGFWVMGIHSFCNVSTLCFV